jgi:Tfp pilus assembly protein PilV
MVMWRSKKEKRSAGFTLVEVAAAISVSLVLTLGFVALEASLAASTRSVSSALDAWATAARALEETRAVAFDALPALHGNTARLGALRVDYAVTLAGQDLYQVTVVATPDDPLASPVRLSTLRARP